MLPRVVFAQYTVAGKVSDRENGTAIANANVFLNNATIGGKTAGDGTFKFSQVKSGTYHLIISIIGFNTYETTIRIDNDIKLPDIYLDRKVAMLSEVRITPKEDPEREANLELFKQAFLGTSQLANQCKLINPEVLDFDYDKKDRVLTAESADMLIIENNALGYRIKYLLSDFIYDQAGGRFLYGGRAFFEEMTGSDLQLKKWIEARQEVYKNSLQHFFRAAINNQLREAGFNVFRLQNNPDRPADSLISKKIAFFSILKDKQPYRDSLATWMKRSRLPKISPNTIPVALAEEDIVQSSNKRGLYTFGCEGDPLYVIYNETRPIKSIPALLNKLYDQNNNSATLINFKQPVVLMDGRGVLANPESLSFTGVWANNRIADLLPDNYEPSEAEPVDKTLFARIDSSLKNYISGHAIEKAYLQLDKALYTPGDTIYFKAYVTDAAYQPSLLSKVLNVELIDPGRHIAQAIKLKLSDGMAAGDFALPDTLKGGYYRIRAYTSLMIASTEKYLFEKYIHLVSPEAVTAKRSKANSNTTVKSKTQARSGKSVANKIDIQFFPEGGNLVAGVQSKVAFKAIDANGFGINVRGIITDEQGHKICDFASQHLGMGAVNFTPRQGSTYKASINYPDSSKATYLVPKPDDSGFGLNISNLDPRLLTVTVSAGAQNRQSEISIAGQSGGKICYFNTGRLLKGRYSLTVRKDIFPEGIVQFTLFSSNGQPMNERLVFIRHHNEMMLKISGADTVSRLRQKVKIAIAATGGDYKPVTGSFSASVVDVSHLPESERGENTILSQLLLTSDLHGYIEQPGYYFGGDNDKVNADMDLLMLTQGYRHFEWKQLLAGKFSADTSQPEKIRMVVGTIKTMTGKPVPKARVSMFSASKVFFSTDTTADENGRFVFKDFPTDSMHYVIQAADKQLRAKTIINIDRELPPGIDKNDFANDGGAANDTDLVAFAKLNQRFHQEQIRQGIGKHSILLKEVVIKDKGKQKYLGHSSNPNGPGNANHVITADQLPPGCLVLTDCIKGSLGRIEFYGGTPYMGGLYGHMETAVFIDGVEVTGRTAANSTSPTKADIINTLSVNDVASIEIITDGSLSAIYGVRGGGGVILITTKRWDDMIPDTKNFKVNYAYYSPPVFYKARTFYSPKYGPENSSFSDLRTTIYWNPEINTDGNGNASFEFFNADTKGTYLVTIEGIDSSGHIGRQTYHYKVE
jgi:TonB-dependent SusC/RagA subfamily outer membrane receptor